MGKTVGVVAPGQSPVADVLDEIAPFFGPDVDILQVGLLDAFDAEAIAALSVTDPETAVAARLRDGQRALVDRAFLEAALADGVAFLEERGADLTLVLTTEPLLPVPSRGPVLYPGRLLVATAAALIPDGTIGIVLPHPRLMRRAAGKWGAVGDRTVFACASPQASASEWLDVSGELRAAGARLVVLDAFAYPGETAAHVAALTRLPVLCARTLTARVAAELL
ncbi:MAG TPA: AroM family protein [Bacillota bacterium]